MSREQKREYNAAYAKTHREAIRANHRRYRERHPEKVRARKRRRLAERRASDPVFRMSLNLRTRVGLALHGTCKSARTLDLLGCTVEELLVHLEAQFKPGMTWENYGPKGWHVDHIRPCASFDLADPEQQRQCFHFTNLQPLWAEENFKKSATYALPI